LFLKREQIQAREKGGILALYTAPSLAIVFVVDQDADADL